ncbi:MAG: pyruvate:ferredoxin (flavodoxin) oxidoreductase [Ruminococcaceae bacterium]|nr:pyruvate:ferredoxin (flavodoxin) oxidoreductase [Oscillospiraceae bacterium]
MKRIKKTVDGNTAAAHAAFAFTEVAAIYPITPSTPMAERTDVWAASGKNLLGDTAQNLMGSVPKVVEMQSEAGVGGAVHGALSAGALTTTYTASQGLLLMLPDMYKIAGEALPLVIHASARTVATHALSIFGDHSDVYACRQSGFAMISSCNPQEVMDLAPVAHLAALEGRVPFLHFFDGFRTSHQIEKIEVWSSEQLKPLLNEGALDAFRRSALHPTRPGSRGAAENGDIYFQHREVANLRYEALPHVVERYMEEINRLLGTSYGLFEYEGAPDAERVVVAMGSFCDVTSEVVRHLVAKGEKVGLVRVRLYRPFVKERFLAVIPQTVRKMAVLDRTKESGAPGEPLYLDVVTALRDSGREICVVGGRYGLASKNTPPADAFAVFEHLKAEAPRHDFTLGITDDVTFRSLSSLPAPDTLPRGTVSCKLWGIGGDGTVGASKSIVKIVGDHTERYVQAYFQYDSKKTGGITVSHLRFGNVPIHAPYDVDRANFVACLHPMFLEKDFPLIDEILPGGTLLVDTPLQPDEAWAGFSSKIRETVLKKEISCYVIDAAGLARREIGNVKVKNMILTGAFFALTDMMQPEEAEQYLAETIRESYGKYGNEVVAQNLRAVTLGKSGFLKISPKTVLENGENVKKEEKMPQCTYHDSAFATQIMDPVKLLRGDSVPVSAFREIEGGIYPPGTTALEKRGIAPFVSCWIPENCIQCNTCAFVCPHATVRAFALNDAELAKAPAALKKASRRVAKSDYTFAIGISPLDCMGCTLCVKSCPVNRRVTEEAEKNGKEPDRGRFAIDMKPQKTQIGQQMVFDFLVEEASEKPELFGFTVRESQFRQPLMEFSGACAGCAEAAYARLVTQLFGQRMYISNATGCSSIWGCSAPSTAYTYHRGSGCGPAWANSLFEDNAEHGLGFWLAGEAARQRQEARLRRLLPDANDALRACIQQYLQADGHATEEEARALVEALKNTKHPETGRILAEKEHLFPRSVWIFGGDGWAYDIGFGGVDHVLASGANVNLLVFDTELYSNTGGQSSKAAGLGQVAQFAFGGKTVGKKSLAEMMLTYGYVYVAQVAMGADRNQLVRALREAEAYPGPALIVAYSPCEMHGIRGGGMQNCQLEMQKAVATGYFPLFRYHPAAKSQKLTIDSPPPSGDFAAFLAGETRYARLAEADPERAEALWKKAEEEAKARYARLLALREAYGS